MAINIEQLPCFALRATQDIVAVLKTTTVSCVAEGEAWK